MSDARKPSVLLVDGYSLIFRAFHALPLMVTKDGTYTNAVHGFFSMLLKALGDYRPDALCVSGLTAGAETDTEVMKVVKDAVKHTPILCNTGCNINNIERQLSVADGAVCATTFKVDGVFENPVDESRVKAFMDKVKRLR